VAGADPAPPHIAYYAATIVAYTDRCARQWGNGRQRDIPANMMALTLAIAGKTLFNADLSDEADEVSQALNTFIGLTQRLLSPGAALTNELQLAPCASLKFYCL
jgi:hypothetical protein